MLLPIKLSAELVVRKQTFSKTHATLHRSHHNHLAKRCGEHVITTSRFYERICAQIALILLYVTLRSVCIPYVCDELYILECLEFLFCALPTRPYANTKILSRALCNIKPTLLDPCPDLSISKFLSLRSMSPCLIIIHRLVGLRIRRDQGVIDRNMLRDHDRWTNGQSRWW